MNGNPVKKAPSLLPFLLMILLPPLAVIPVVNRIASDPGPQDYQAWARAAMKLKNYPAAEAYLSRLMETEPLRASHAVWYVSVHFALAEGRRDDQGLLAECGEWAKDKDPRRRDIGRLTVGQVYLETEQPEKALHALEQVQNRRLPYLHTFEGRGYAQLGDDEKAEASFQTEIAGGGDTAGAVRQLSRLYLDRGDTGALKNLYEDPNTRPYLPAKTIRYLALRRGWIWAYAVSLARPLAESGNAVGITGAFLILVLWVYFLRRLDPFEPEKMRYVLLTLGLGMLTPFLASVLYDLVEMVGLRPGAGPGRDLLYCIFGVGLIEESVKLLPVVFMIRCTREVNESIDYLIYASLSALGFSFVENILYFDDASLFMIKERGMICCVGHMFYTSLILYGLVLARYGRKGSPAVNLVLCFLLACVFHGVYDFFLISEVPRVIGGSLAVGLALLMAVLYVRMLNNTLNQSEYFDPARVGQFVKVRQILGAGLVGIVLFEYTGVALRYGPTLTYERYLSVIVFTWSLVLFFASTLGTYTIRRRLWLPWWKQTAQPIADPETMDRV